MLEFPFANLPTDMFESPFANLPTYMLEFPFAKTKLLVKKITNSDQVKPRTKKYAIDTYHSFKFLVTFLGDKHESEDLWQRCK